MNAMVTINKKKKPGKHVVPFLKDKVAWHKLSDNVWPEINTSVMLTTAYRGGTEANTSYGIILDAKLRIFASGEIDGFYTRDGDGHYMIPIYIDDVIAWSYDTIDIDAFCYKDKEDKL